MIRCPNCKMLNRLGSLHCGSCGQLLTEKEVVGPEVQFKAPKLSPSESREDLARPESGDAASAPGAVEGDQAGVSGGELCGEQASAGSAKLAPTPLHRTVMGMPVVRLDEAGELDELPFTPVAPLREDDGPAPPPAPDPTIRGRALPDAIERGAPSAQVAGSGPSPAVPSEAPPPEPKAKRPSKTLFGMRAAELHLGMAEADAGLAPAPPPHESRAALADTAEVQQVVRRVPDLGPPPPRKKRARPAGSDARIQPVAPLKGPGPGFAETAVVATLERPAESTAAAAQEGAEATLLGQVTAARRICPPPLAIAAADLLGRIVPAQAPAERARTEQAVRRTPGWIRGLQLLAGFCLIFSSLLPFSASTWSRVVVWGDLMPLLVGAVGLSLAIPRRVPSPLILLVGLSGAAVLALQFLEVGWPGWAAGSESVARFGLVVAGSVLLLIGALSAAARGSGANSPRPLEQPPPS